MEPRDDTPSILSLVCGSRSLVERPNGEAWARHLVECIADHADGIVTGDAPGPDTWAREEAARRGIPCAVYALDGVVRNAAGADLGRWCKVHEVPRPSSPRYPRWPLERNRVMVRAVALRAQRDARDAAAYALHDPKTRTNGTMHTVTLARRVGLTAFVETFCGEGPLPMFEAATDAAPGGA